MLVDGESLLLNNEKTGNFVVCYWLQADNTPPLYARPGDWKPALITSILGPPSMNDDVWLIAGGSLQHFLAVLKLLTSTDQSANMGKRKIMNYNETFPFFFNSLF